MYQNNKIIINLTWKDIRETLILFFLHHNIVYSKIFCLLPEITINNINLEYVPRNNMFSSQKLKANINYYN
jgi:hypothetical protein